MRTMMCHAFTSLIGCFVITMAATHARAHGGEDHAHEAPAAVAPNANMRVASATSSSVELVLRWPARAASEGAQRFRALLSDYATNAPIEGASIQTSLASAGRADIALLLKETSSPGIYEGEVTLPADGTYSASLTIVAGELVDVLAVSGVEVGPPTASEEPPHDHGDGRMSAAFLIGAIALGALVLLVIVVVMRRRKNPPAAAPALALFIAVCASASASTIALAHGDDDHGASKAANAPKLPSGRVFLAKESQFLLGVRTALVAERSIAERVSVPGVITVPPERHAAVFLPQSGRVAPPRGGFPQLGARVKRGQLLGVVEAVMTAGDRASFLSEEARGRADVGASTARLEAARRNLQRLESLSGVASKQEIDAARVEVAAAEADLEAARARASAFSTTNGGTARFELTSPLDGVLADINVSPGEVLNQGERAFLVIDPVLLTVEAKVPEHELARLHDSGDAVVHVDAFPARAFAGRLLAEGQVIDEATRTAKVIFDVDNKDGLLKLGMFARVEIGATPKSADGGPAHAMTLAVPDDAILDIDGRRVVYVRAAPEEFEERELELGRRDGNLVEVKRGLKAGERVVVIGGYTLRSAAR